MIADTEKYHFQAWRQVGNQLGLSLPEEHLFSLKNLSGLATLEKILDWGKVYMPEAEKLYWADRKNNLYHQLIADLKPGEILPGVLIFLRHLRGMEIKTALCSSAPHTTAILKSAQMEPFFEAVIDSGVFKKPKPDPQSFLLAADALGVSPGACLVFESDPQGIEAALLGGFSVAGVGDPVELCRAHFTIPSFAGFRLPALMKQLFEQETS